MKEPKDYATLDGQEIDVYIIKYALSRKVYRTKARVEANSNGYTGAHVHPVGGRFCSWASYDLGTEAVLTPEVAIARITEMQTKKMASLEKQRKKIVASDPVALVANAKGGE